MTDGMQGGPCPLCNNVKEATYTPSSSWEVSQGVKSKRDAAGGTVAIGNNMAVPQKLYRITISSSKSTIGYTSKRIKSKDLNKYLHTCVQRALIITVKRSNLSVH